jgi:hypothetical protein
MNKYVGWAILALIGTVVMLLWVGEYLWEAR